MSILITRLFWSATVGAFVGFFGWLVRPGLEILGSAAAIAMFWFLGKATEDLERDD